MTSCPTPPPLEPILAIPREITFKAEIGCLEGRIKLYMIIFAQLNIYK